MPFHKASNLKWFKAFQRRGKRQQLLLLPLAVGLALVTMDGADAGRLKSISTAKELQNAVRKAQPGDVLTLVPGRYETRGKIKVNRPGRPGAPIVLRAAKLGEVRIMGTGVAFHVTAPDWIFENLDIEGRCKKHLWCEHAFHITGSASRTVIRNNRLHEYNAMIKINGNLIKNKATGKRRWIYPNDVLIEGNIFFNATVRDTANPVTTIDVVGGRRLIVRGNLLADFAKSGGNRTSYGAFMKAMSRDGVFERNLVICELAHFGQIRIGLSFGGGGSPLKIRDDPIGDIENLNGIMRNNIIMNCPNEVGIYINKGSNSKIYNNTLYNTYGIDVRFKESSADIRNNIIAGGIRERDGGTSTAVDNLVAGTSYGLWFPGGARYLKRRLKGQDVKYPGYIKKSHVEFVQSLVDDALALVAPTWIGHGANSLKALFDNPDRANFSLREPERVIDKGQVLADVRDDFCGNLRNTPPHDIGAIEYGAKNCDVATRIRGAFGDVWK